MRARWSDISEAVVFKVYILGKTSGSDDVRGTAIKHCPTRLCGIFRSISKASIDLHKLPKIGKK